MTLKKQRIELKRDQQWLIEVPGASALTRCLLRDVYPNAVRIHKWSDLYSTYSSSLEEWLARDRVRFVQRLTAK